MESKLGQMDGSPVSYPGGRLLEWWSSGREEAPQLGSADGSCKEVGSDRAWGLGNLNGVGADPTERGGSGTRIWDLAERVNSGINPGDLAERVNSGTNLGRFD
ncbi:hypothetical protein BHE74_00044280 [Ensete ventricosum]|nr:hypothetical protein BHE74_00044280 [Ensete ventricosum]